MRGNRKRTHHVELAMNDAEYEKFTASVKRCGLSKQKYLLMLVTDRIPQERPSEDFQEVIRQLRKIGNNINQLTIVANKNGSIDITYFKKMMEDLNHQIVDIRKQVYLPHKVS